MTSPLRRRVAVPAAILFAAATGCLLLAPEAPPSAALYEPSARALRVAPAREPDDVNAGVAAAHHGGEDLGLYHARLLKTLALMPHGESIRYFAHEEDRRDALRAVLPCDGPKQVPWWRDIDYQQAGLCGAFKCFFRSLCDPTMGYLVEAGDDDETSGYDVAKELEAEHGIKHFYAAPPFEAGWSAPKFVERLTDTYVEFYAGAEELVVQPTVAAPEGSTVVRCFGPHVGWHRLTDRLEQVLEGTDEAVQDRLIGDLEHAVEVTEAMPELVSDFQLMIDPEGNAYHIDLDRVEKGTIPSKWAREMVGVCLEDAITFVNAVKNDDEDAKAKLRKKQEKWEGLAWGESVSEEE